MVCQFVHIYFNHNLNAKCIKLTQIWSTLKMFYQFAMLARLRGQRPFKNGRSGNWFISDCLFRAPVLPHVG